MDNFDQIPPEIRDAMTEMYQRREDRTITVKLSTWTAYTMVSYLQLAWRHPGLTDRHRQEIRSYADQILPADVLPPAMVDVLAKGWDTSFDVGKPDNYGKVEGPAQCVGCGSADMTYQGKYHDYDVFHCGSCGQRYEVAEGMIFMSIAEDDDL